MEVEEGERNDGERKASRGFFCNPLVLCDAFNEHYYFAVCTYLNTIV